MPDETAGGDVPLDEMTLCEPVPANVPGEFVVYLGTDEVPEWLDPDLTALLLTWIAWVEVEVWGFPVLLEGLCRLRGAVMTAAAVG